MKKYIKEIIVLIIQLLVFYILPLFAGPTDGIGLVFLILLSTSLLSIVIAILSKNKIKYAYSIIIAILFIPSVFIYYNKSALIHAVWYLIVASIGLLIGTIFNKLLNIIIKK